MAGRSDLTAMARRKASAPLRWLMAHDYVSGADGAFLDLGCGKGADVDHLMHHGAHVWGYDPNHRDTPEVLTDRLYDVVLCTFVANVLNREERRKLYDQIRGLMRPDGEAWVSVRRDVEKGPGYTTSRGTYQEWVDVAREQAGTWLNAELVREVSGYAIFKLTRRDV